LRESIAESIAQLDEDKTLELVRLGLEKGSDPQQIVEELRKGVDEVGTQFAKSNLFLTDLIMAAEIFKGALRLLKPRLSNQKVGKTLGKVTIGTVKGDVHDIGKNIVVMT
jgi:5-methyltetrahydrofolate--homocysteine methyltransferase